MQWKDKPKKPWIKCGTKKMSNWFAIVPKRMSDDSWIWYTVLKEYKEVRHNEFAGAWFTYEWVIINKKINKQ